MNLAFTTNLHCTGSKPMQTGYTLDEVPNKL